MKYIKTYKIFEALSRAERVYSRNKEAFNNMSDSDKKKYDANYILEELTKKYPKEKFQVTNYYDTEAKVVFLSENSQYMEQRFTKV